MGAIGGDGEEIIAYNFDRKTGRYTYCEVVDRSPLDNELLIPGNSTLVPPPLEVPPGAAPYFVGGKWMVKADKELARVMRVKRNEALARSDWRMLSDVVNSNRDAWAAYRQELRDLPSHPAWPLVGLPEEPMD